jgi:hypothetical protein
MRVTEIGSDKKSRTFYKKFTIATRRTVGGYWQYQLNDPITGSLYEAGKWYSETSLSSA